MSIRNSAPLQLGVIGVGGIAEVAHLPNYHQLGAQVTAVCTNHPERIEETLHRYGINRSFRDYQQLLAIEEIDAVSVCVPTFLHKEITVAALSAGKHVLCEKPPAISAQDAAEMLAVAQKNDRQLVYAFSARFRAEVRKLKAFAQKGKLGDIYGAKVGWMRRRGNPAGWFTDKARAGGGAMIDLGVHGLDLAWWIMGRPAPVSVTAEIYNKFGNYHSDDAATPDPVMQRHLVSKEKTTFDVEDSAFAMVRFADGSHLMIEASWALNCPAERRYTTFYGTKGGAHLENGLQLYTEIDGTLVDIQAHIQPADAYRNQVQHFVAVLKGQEKPIATAQDGVVVMQMIDAIYKSANEHREITIDQVLTKGLNNVRG